MKIARILDEADGTFRLDYDDTIGHKRNTRLDALSYEQALREAKGYLEIGEGDRDPAVTNGVLNSRMLPPGGGTTACKKGAGGDRKTSSKAFSRHKRRITS